MARFGTTRFDEDLWADHVRMKEIFEGTEKELDRQIESCREKSMVLTKLEEAFLWFGKALRYKQVMRRRTGNGQGAECDQADREQSRNA
jgi:hypothetical protein